MNGWRSAPHRDLHSVDMRDESGLRVAVMDTDSGFLQVLTKRMERLGWEHRSIGGPTPVETLVAMRIDAVIVDPAIFAPHAFDELERICAGLPGLPVLVCTAPATVAQRVRGLRLGADDWISKPCHPEEVIARVDAVVRRIRRSQQPTSSAITIGEVEIRADQFQAFVAGHSIDLTRREFELITLLSQADGRVLEREEIYQRVWGYTMARGDRSVDVFVRKLRQKLEAASPGWRYIHTHFGVGYRFAAEPQAATAVPPAPADSARQARSRHAEPVGAGGY